MAPADEINRIIIRIQEMENKLTIVQLRIGLKINEKKLSIKKNYNDILRNNFSRQLFNFKILILIERTLKVT